MSCQRLFGDKQSQLVIVFVCRPMGNSAFLALVLRPLILRKSFSARTFQCCISSNETSDVFSSIGGKKLWSNCRIPRNSQSFCSHGYCYKYYVRTSRLIGFVYGLCELRGIRQLCPNYEILNIFLRLNRVEYHSISMHGICVSIATCLVYLPWPLTNDPQCIARWDHEKDTQSGGRQWDLVQ